jgi:hypothetical protein
MMYHPVGVRNFWSLFLPDMSVFLILNTYTICAFAMNDCFAAQARLLYTEFLAQMVSE